jgi:hypothetical protein
MERALKRAPGGGWTFTIDGEPVSAEQLFTTYNQQLLLVMERATHADLRALSRSSRLASAWIERNRLWRRLFARDYPEAYALAIRDSQTRDTMSLAHEARLNNISAHRAPSRSQKHWKRYYELMVRPLPRRRDRFNAGGRLSTALSGMAVMITMGHYNGENLDLLGAKMHVHRTIPADEAVHMPGLGPDIQTVAHLGFWKNAQGQPIGPLLQMQIDPRRDILHYNIVMAEEIALGPEVVYEGKVCIWRSANGFREFCATFARNTDAGLSFMVKDTIGPDDMPLISAQQQHQCIGCAVTGVPLYQCGACSTDTVGYCGRDCQVAHWPAHKLKCGKRI